jgi:hypothetical protein
MIFSLRKWWERAKFVSLFLIFTFLIYHLLHIVTAFMEPHHRFQEPSGRAVKAYAPSDQAIEPVTFSERLRFFYWYGE